MHQRSLLSLSNFFAAGNYFLFLFVLAPYLATLLPAHLVGVVVSAGAFVTLIFFPFMPRLANIFGPRKIALILSTATIAGLTLLAHAPSDVAALILVALILAIAPFIAYQLDLMLQALIVDETSEGRIRTAFLTAGNLALVLAPFASGWLLGTGDDYPRIFLAGAITMIPFFLFLFFEKFPEGVPPKLRDIRETLSCILKNADTRAIMIVAATLQFAFHLLPLYIPLYLHIELGIPWNELGWMFSIMLLPFVLVEYPVGWLADQKFGDKRIIFWGFVISGLATALVAYIGEQTPVLFILGILVFTRIGLAVVEAVSESHFFRHVSPWDKNSITVFRMIRPLCALAAPLIGSALLFFGGYHVLFLIAGTLFMFFGAGGALYIKRTN